MSNRTTLPYPARSLVVADDVTFVNGTVAAATPDNAFDSPEQFLMRMAGAARAMRLTEMTVLLEHSAAKQLGFPQNAPQAEKTQDQHHVINAMRSTGYRVSKLKPWFTAWLPGRPSIHFGILPWLTKTNFVWHDCEDSGSLAWRLMRFQMLTGGAFQRNPGTAATSLLRDHYSGRDKVEWTPKWAGCTAALSDCERPWIWDDPEEMAVNPQRLGFAFDATRQYLAAAWNTPAPVGTLRHTRRRAFTRKACGYWRIVAPVWNIPGLPNPSGWETGAECWVTTPTMELLEDLAEDGFVVVPDVLDSWTTDEGIRDLFRPWVTQLETAYWASVKDTTPDGVAVTEAIKDTYKRGVGMMHVSKSRVHRPDWHHSIIAKARANLFRKMFGVWKLDDITPVHINYDTVVYATGAPKLIPKRINRNNRKAAAYPLGTGLGDFTVKPVELINGKWKVRKNV